MEVDIVAAVVKDSAFTAELERHGVRFTSLSGKQCHPANRKLFPSRFEGLGIAALLELASGFGGDLTVRENTYLRGAMLGYTRMFMNDTYDQIIDFGGLQEFQDRPLK